MIKRMIVTTFILFAVLLLMLPGSDDASKKKMASAAMLMCSNEFRDAVAEQIKQGDEIAAQFDNRCPKLIANLSVDSGGIITLLGAQHEIKMVLTPRVEPGEIHWSCSGKPSEAITKLCKP